MGSCTAPALPSHVCHIRDTKGNVYLQAWSENRTFITFSSPIERTSGMTSDEFVRRSMGIVRSVTCVMCQCSKSPATSIETANWSSQSWYSHLQRLSLTAQRAQSPKVTSRLKMTQKRGWWNFILVWRGKFANTLAITSTATNSRAWVRDCQRTRPRCPSPTLTGDGRGRGQQHTMNSA